MHHYPAFLAIKQTPCVVIGGGAVAQRKVNTLLQAGADVTVIAPQLCSELQALAKAEHIHYQERSFSRCDLDNAMLVIAATNNPTLNQQIAQQAKQNKQWVNVVDDPDSGNFIVPSVVDRSPVTIAVSTGGASPVLARQLRMRLETMVPSSCGQLAAITEAYRDRVKQRFSDAKERKAFWEMALAGPFAELVYAGQITEAEKRLDKLLADPDAGKSMGEVYLVGAGPGDPDLLTFKALRLMQQADVMVYDRLVAKSILDMANQHAERIYVGKEKNNHAIAQEKINDILVKLAKQGKRVLRLKGGDPFIFGRGGEEIETLAAEGVPFQVVPGITAASGCASYSGIPLTHRDHAQSCSFVTGHLKDGSIDLNWQQLVQPNHTIVFYMGLTGISVISEQLQAHGMDADMPAALIEQGTTRNQHVHIGTVSSLPQLVKDSGVRAPTLTIIGQVVQLHDKLNWYKPERHVKVSEFSRNTPKTAEH